MPMAQTGMELGSSIYTTLRSLIIVEEFFKTFLVDFPTNISVANLK
jgi:hypothetical protein